MRVLKGEWSGPRTIAFSPDGRQIAAADSDLTNPAIRLWDLETGTMRVLGRSLRQVTSIAFLSERSELVSGSWDETGARVERSHWRSAYVRRELFLRLSYRSLAGK
jgi:WD40 repeat protein